MMSLTSAWLPNPIATPTTPAPASSGVMSTPRWDRIISEVTTVKNLTRDFAYVVARITISHDENIDRVVDILREVCSELAADQDLGASILDPFDYQGVDALDASAVVLLVRIRTTAGKQWAVGRAFNRRVKMAFDEHGISSRDPTQIAILEMPAAPAGCLAGR